MGTGLIGILTAGGDCPGLNAGIRAVGKAAHRSGMQVIGFLDGFRGLVENRTVRLDDAALSGILATGGTILGTSRDKPHKIPVPNVGTLDMRPMAVENYNGNHLDCLVCLGGDGTMKNAYRLSKEGLNIIALPKTIDNDVPCTDTTFGFDTAMGIAAEAIDRLHTTADSHHRVIIVEIMGHTAGWLALGAGLAGGADVILLPEIPYDIDKVTEAILNRERRGKRFSIVAVAEGALPLTADEGSPDDGDAENDGSDGDGDEDDSILPTRTALLAQALQRRTGIDARFTALGHLQRGGTPSAADRLLATRLGTTCIDYVEQGMENVMVAVDGDGCKAVSLKKVAGRRKLLPLDHPWIDAARRLGIALGD
ncbi:MAG: ATP-dependent 6-phosphofructokinase [Chloroflexi bacterium]|nr:ATP-dependent 6-phosphofructokinase [Chloroflexota bacterium]